MLPYLNITCENCNNTSPCNCTNSCGNPLISSNDIGYQGPALSCIGVENCDTLSVALQKIDNTLCGTTTSTTTLFPPESTQNNFVRILNIPESALVGIGSLEEKICAYILALPEAERTILETDSVWNIVIVASILYTEFSISVLTFEALGGVDCVSPVVDSPIIEVAYHSGVNPDPQVGDSIFIDQEGTIPHADGHFVGPFSGFSYPDIFISGGIVIDNPVIC